MSISIDSLSVKQVSECGIKMGIAFLNPHFLALRRLSPRIICLILKPAVAIGTSPPPQDAAAADIAGMTNVS